MPRFAVLIVVLSTAGCGTVRDRLGPPTPTRAGLNARDVIDPPAQAEADAALQSGDLTRVAGEVRTRLAATADPGRPPRHVLCLSGGGSFGAYSAGVLCGWTDAGTRPEFDVVTGISTGSLIAPLAFLGPKYDPDVRRFYTDIRTRDIYVKRVVLGLVSESMADTRPLARKLDEVITPGLVAEIAEEHRKGRRLYVGTTELEGKRFVVWDIGAIACRADPGATDLIKRILLGSSAIPGFFPPSKIAVTVDGRSFVEKHGDGGVSQAIFFRPPPPDAGPAAAAPLAGTTVWCVVAGKLYADPDPIKPRALAIAGSSVGAVLYAQTRGDLQRIFTLCTLTGMDYRLTAIPDDFDAPKSSAEFEQGPMTRMFDEGYRLARAGEAWRLAPPGLGPRESPLTRSGTALTALPPPGGSVQTVPGPPGLLAPGPLPIPAPPGVLMK
ncbi:MAG: patatin-like phospholipase family protein [Gemmataceae bacterium]